MNSAPPVHGPGSSQPFLTGFDIPAKATDRLFFAILPTRGAADRIAGLAQSLRSQHGLRGRPLANERFHITLHHLGDHPGVPANLVAAAGKAAAAMSMPSFDLSFDRIGSFSRKSDKPPLVLLGGDGFASLVGFQRELGTELKRVGLGRCVDSRFTPHVTMLYDEHEVAEQVVDPIGWTVTEFVLVHSLLGQTRHILLGRWSLGGSAQG